MAWCLIRVIIDSSLSRTLSSSVGVKGGENQVDTLDTELNETQPCWWRTQDKGAQRNTFSSFGFQHSTLCICVTDRVNGLENSKACIVSPRVRDKLSEQRTKTWLLFRAVTITFQNRGVNQICFSCLAWILCSIQFPKKVYILNILFIYKRFLKLHMHALLNQY